MSSVSLDTMMVNDPEDEGLDWDQIIWPVHEEHVRRLRRRIFKATQASPPESPLGLA